MNSNGIEVIHETKYKTPDGKVYDSLEDAKRGFLTKSLFIDAKKWLDEHKLMNYDLEYVLLGHQSANDTSCGYYIINNKNDLIKFIEYVEIVYKRNFYYYAETLNTVFDNVEDDYFPTYIALNITKNCFFTREYILQKFEQTKNLIDELESKIKPEEEDDSTKRRTEKDS